jgi:hypothetical protein
MGCRTSAVLHLNTIICSDPSARVHSYQGGSGLTAYNAINKAELAFLSLSSELYRTILFPLSVSSSKSVCTCRQKRLRPRASVVFRESR